MTRRDKKEKPGTTALVALEEIVFNKKLIKDLKMVTEFHHTGNLEVYHSMMIKYCPKRQHFSHEGMVAKTQLAVLDNNHNCSRNQAVVKKGSNVGSLRYNLVFPKMHKTWVVKSIKEGTQFGYIITLMENILKYKKSKKAKKSTKMQKILPQKKGQTRTQQLRLTLADSSSN